MRIFKIISWSLVILGLLLKMLHYPGGSISLVLGCTLLFLHGMLFLFINFKNKLLQGLMHLSIGFWMLFIMWRVQYWSGVRPMFMIALLVCIITFIVYFSKKMSQKPSLITFVSVSLLSILLSITPTYRIHSFISLNPILYSVGRTENYHEWDKNCWFLYQVKREDEALQANDEAIKALMKFGEAGHEYSIGEYYLLPGGASTLQILEQRKRQIKDRTWRSFP